MQEFEILRFEGQEVLQDSDIQDDEEGQGVLCGRFGAFRCEVISYPG